MPRGIGAPTMGTDGAPDNVPTRERGSLAREMVRRQLEHRSMEQ
jgi:hypothetical protein